jgi:DNA polymerase-3 subunit beta
MKFIVSSTTLLKHLSQINGVLSSKSTIPILDNFLFNVTPGKLTVCASDLETTMITYMEVESKDSGKIAVPAKLLIDTLKTFSEQPLTFTIDEDNFGIEISSDNGKYKLTGHNAEEYPKIPTVESPSKFEMSASAFATGINKTIFATGNDDLRPVMSGVFFELTENGVNFVATDAHKLVRYRRLDVKSFNNASFILPKKPLNLLRNILSGEEGNIRIEYNPTSAFFEYNNLQLICRLIDGKYPNYEAVIPKENPNKLTIERQAFTNSIKRVSIFSNKTTNQIRLKITGNELQISAQDLDFSNEAIERLNCQYEGQDMEIGFNSLFLLDMLNNIDTELVNLEMSAPNRAGILLPVDYDNKEEDLLMLVMPIMLHS